VAALPLPDGLPAGHAFESLIYSQLILELNQSATEDWLAQTGSKIF
jgi:hypothetical protein